MAMVMVHSQEYELTAKRDLLLLDALNDHVDIDVDVDVVFPFPTCCIPLPLRELSTIVYKVQCTCALYLCPAWWWWSCRAIAEQHVTGHWRREARFRINCRPGAKQARVFSSSFSPAQHFLPPTILLHCTRMGGPRDK